MLEPGCWTSDAAAQAAGGFLPAMVFPAQVLVQFLDRLALLPTEKAAPPIGGELRHHRFTIAKQRQRGHCGRGRLWLRARHHRS